MTKSFFSIAFFCLFVFNGLMAQNQLPLNHMSEMKAAMMLQNKVQDSLFLAARGVTSGVCCEDVWLLIPEDQSNPGYKINLPLGVNLKPILESYITGGATTLSLSAVGDAVGCNVQCGDQMITDWSLGTGNIFGTNINYGTFSIIQADQPGNYIILGRTSDKGCFVAETFKVTCDADTVFFTNTVTEFVTDSIVILFSFAGGTTATTNLVESNEIYPAPNPVSEGATLKVINVPLGVTGKVVNTSGQIVATPEDLSSFNLDGLPAGLYFVQMVQNNTLVGTVKVVKQ